MAWPELSFLKPKPVKALDQPPCFNCSMNFNNRGIKCFDWCDRVRLWLDIQEEKAAHIRRQEAALSAAARKADVELERLVREIEKESEEFISALDESGAFEREELSDEEIEAIADEILREVEGED